MYALVVAGVFAGVAIGGASLWLFRPGSPPSPAPVASFAVLRTLMHVDVDASRTADPEGDIASYEWDFEDDGTFDASGVTASFDYASPGRYAIRLRATDALGHEGLTTRYVSVASSTLDFALSEFFGVGFGEWWDYRGAVYGEAAVGAECFSQTGIDNGVCTPTDPEVPDLPAFPYTHWSDLPDGRGWSDPRNVPTIYAPYRLDALGDEVPGYTLAWPVFLPVLNASAVAGARLEFNWTLRFLDTATATTLQAAGCPISTFALDGYHVRSLISITLDLQESRRVFGVEGADAAAAQSWWNAGIDPSCIQDGAIEADVQGWFSDMGGRPIRVGKYDIYNAYEWFWDPAYTAIEATVDPDGTTHVSIDNVAWGTGNLLSRMFYWGNASYADRYLDSTEARGWLGMEPLGWFEDFMFRGTLSPDDMDFSLQTVVQYHFRHIALPGPDGALNRNGDIPVWTWGPVLQDYLNDFAPEHLASELDRYPGSVDVHSTPGGRPYGSDVPFDYAPVRWDLAAGQTLGFGFPASDVVFFDPNLTPIPANPASRDHVQVHAPIKLLRSEPDDFGVWDPAAHTWEVFGPASTGGPPGTPGPDGIPGTSDDAYALEPWPDALFAPEGTVGPSYMSHSGPATIGAPHGRVAVPAADASRRGLGS